MKRMHIHISVAKLADSIEFYSTIFGTPPTVERKEYAKWQLDQPSVNFAISKRGHANGVNHLGIQVDSEDELAEIAQRLNNAELNTSEQKGTSCCYAQSNKHWALDPQGIAWESFHTLSESPVFGYDNQSDANDESSACCIPLMDNDSSIENAACCLPTSDTATGCC